MTARRPLVGGNWKMNTARRTAAALARAVADGAAPFADAVETVVFPPFVYLEAVGAQLRPANGAVRLGAQDLWHEPDGAFTGEISAAMLADVGATFVLTGHSERRHVVGESDDLVGRKTTAAVDAGLTCILCVGETLEQRQAGQTDAVNERQLRAGLAAVPRAAAARIVIAYEPVWAIGTGKTATPDDAQAAHARIRAVLASIYDAPVAAGVRIIYGGSVKPSNALELFSRPDLDGGLIGGASLAPDDFLSICADAARASTAPQGTLR